jgi:hypothetical protein
MAHNDEFGYHELLHTAHIVACMWEDHIEGHGIMNDDEVLRFEAERIGKEVASFYQFVGRRIYELGEQTNEVSNPTQPDQP